MKRFFRPLYLLITATVLVFALLAWLFLGTSGVKVEAENAFMIGRDPSWYPLDLQGKAYELLAFSDELLDEVADKQGLIFTYVDENSESIFPSLQRGAVDGVVTASTPDVGGNRYLFSDPFYDFGPVLVVRTDSKAASLNDIKGEILGLIRGSSLYLIPLDPSIFVVTFDNALQAMERLANKNIDAALLPFLPASIFSQSLFNGRVKIASLPIISEPLRVVALNHKKGQSLIQNVNAGLKILTQNSEYQALIERWSLPNSFKASE